MSWNDLSFLDLQYYGVMKCASLSGILRLQPEREAEDGGVCQLCHRAKREGPLKEAPPKLHLPLRHSQSESSAQPQGAIQEPECV